MRPLTVCDTVGSMAFSPQPFSVTDPGGLPMAGSKKGGPRQPTGPSVQPEALVAKSGFVNRFALTLTPVSNPSDATKESRKRFIVTPCEVPASLTQEPCHI